MRTKTPTNALIWKLYFVHTFCHKSDMFKSRDRQTDRQIEPCRIYDKLRVINITLTVERLLVVLCEMLINART
jgi:hypothetical protein